MPLGRKIKMKMYKCPACSNISDKVDEVIRNLEEWSEIRILTNREIKGLGQETFDFPYKFDPGDSEVVYNNAIQEYFCQNCGYKIPDVYSLLELQQYLEDQA
jgi:DNA-directed RNA polymerase subunit RPC12/RpoP